MITIVILLVRYLIFVIIVSDGIPDKEDSNLIEHFGKVKKANTNKNGY